MPKRLNKKFWIVLAVFGLMGQVAWVVENMYFNVFIYKMFHASAAEISRAGRNHRRISIPKRQDVRPAAFCQEKALPRLHRPRIPKRTLRH